MCTYLNNIIHTQNSFLLNASANACLTPLYGILSLCGFERRVFNYSIAIESFTEVPRESREHCTAIQILTYAAFALLVIPSTLVGLTLKAISLCDPELRALYQRLWARVTQPPALPVPRQNIPIQSPAQALSTGLFSIGNTLLFHCVFPYATIQDLITIESVSRQTFQLMHTPAALGKYPVFFSLQPKEKCSLVQHLRAVFSTRLSDEAIALLDPDFLFQKKSFPYFKIPVVDQVHFTHHITAEEREDFSSRTPGLGSFTHVPFKVILRQVHRWWGCNLEKLSQFPSIFRLFVKASIDGLDYDSEILLIKYTLFYFTMRSEATEHHICHAYLALLCIENCWHCFDSRAINLLSDKSLIARQRIAQFPPRFIERVNQEPTRISSNAHPEDVMNHVHIGLLMEEKVLPLIRDADTPIIFETPRRKYNNLPMIIGHRTLEEMEQLFSIKTSNDKETYEMSDYRLSQKLSSASLFRRDW